MKVVLKNLTKRFPSRGKKGDDVIAVNNFDFEIPDGKLIGLLGPSGCGKSTTLNLISGLETPSSGSIFFGEDDVTRLPPENRGVGLVFQNYALYPHLTVLDNILFPLQNLKGPERPSKEQMKQRAMEAARLVQIDGLLERKPSELSGGQQQRVAIARALVKMPRVLLLDEPLSNLDARLRLQTREEIRRIQQETGITTIFVTHDQEEAMSISEPINVFDGAVKAGKLLIGDAAVCDTPGVADQAVSVGIRPEGFVLDPEGPFQLNLSRVEVMGRDTSVVSTHPACRSPFIRAIIPARNRVDRSAQTVRFSLLPEKVHLFAAGTDARIPFDIQ